MPIERMHKADPYKTKRTPKRTSLMRQADALWSQIIRLRAGRCESCGHVGALEAAHVIPRRHRSVRWDPENGHALCRACHRRYTLSEKAWRDFIGPEWDRLWSLALQPWDRTYPIALLKAALAAVRKDAA
jgi:5-methylcytosine-specific restriction endonuclease McrA